MKRLVIVAALPGLALAGCNVNVTSNDAATQNTIDAIKAGAADAMNQAGNIAEDAGNEIGRAARAAGNAADQIGAGDSSNSTNSTN